MILTYTYILSILSRFTWIISVEKFLVLTKLSVLDNHEVVNELTYYGKWILYKITSSTFENRGCPSQFVPHAMSYLIVGLMTILQEIVGSKHTWDILVPLFWVKHHPNNPNLVTYGRTYSLVKLDHP